MVSTFTSSEPGYGFVAEDIPEIGLAVAASFRGRGAGSALLRELQVSARRLGFTGLSLSVHPENPARRMYQSNGFVQIRSAENAVTMLWRT